MTDIAVAESIGWSGIVAALRRAQPGDRVLIGPGRYSGDETLNVPSGVTLRGCAEADLEFTGTESAIRIFKSHKSRVENINIQAYRNEKSTFGISSKRSTVSVSESSFIEVRNCRIESLAEVGSAVELMISRNCDIENNYITGNIFGLKLVASSNINIIRNSCHECKENAITLRPSWNTGWTCRSITITKNLCTSSGSGGIAVLSSECNEISGNICYDNTGPGIVIVHDNIFNAVHNPVSSCNSVSNNFCFANETGISIFGSICNDVTNNICYLNSLSGIIITDYNCEIISICGRLEKNIAAYNENSGLHIKSAVIRSVGNNNLYMNKNSGLSIDSIKNKEFNTEECSIYFNNFAKNDGNGLQVIDSNCTVEGNVFLNSEASGLIFENSDVVGSGNVTDIHLDIYNSSIKLNFCFPVELLNGANLAETSEFGLMQFLRGPSAICFRAFWTGQRIAPEPGLATGSPPESRRWRLSEISGGTMAAPERLSVLPAGLVMTLVGKATRAEGGKANWCALVISDEIDSEDICHAFESRANAESADYVAAGERSGAPVRVEMEGDEATLHERLSTALMAGKSSRAERWGLLARLALWPAIVVAVMAVGFWLSPWSPLAKVVFSKFDFWAWVGTLFAGISGFLAVFSFLDLFMPRHLRAGETGTAAILSDGAKNVLDDRVSSLLETISRLIPQSKRDAWVEQADLNWQRKQLFGKADIATIYLSDVTCWRKGDLAWLSMLGRSLSGYQKLNVLIELDGRLSLRPLLLEPLEVPWKDGIDLYLFDDVDKLRLEEPDEMSGKPEDHIVGLFGAQVPDASKMINELIDDNWCPTDMVATLPIASAPTHRMRLVSKNVDDEGLLADSALVKEMYPAARALFTSGRDDLPVSLDSVKRLVGHAYRARALHCSETGRFNSIAGRAGYRREVAGLMRGIWKQNADDTQNLMDWREYVASALRFGIWHAVTDAAKALETPLSKEASLKIRRTFEAVRFLGEDLEYIMAGSPPVHGEQEVYGPAWQRLRSCMASLADGPEVPTIIGAWLGAEELCFGALPDVIEEWQLRIEVLMADPIACDAARAKTAGEAFCIATARQLIDLQQLDPVSRRHSLDRAESTIWRGYPDSLLDRFWKWANGRGANSKSLAMLFSDARDAETIEKLIRMHRRNPLRTVYALANAATNHIIADHLDDGALLTFDERMPLVARTLAEFRMMWIDKWGDKAVQLSREFAQGASGAAVTAQSAYDFMTREGASAQILELLTPDGMAVLEDLEGQFELELVA
jgi:parallel beta-helix repeat protein